MIHFTCPVCSNHVAINIPGRLDTPAMNAAIKAWCHNRHAPERMTVHAPPPVR